MAAAICTSALYVHKYSKGRRPNSTGKDVIFKETK